MEEVEKLKIRNAVLEGALKTARNEIESFYKNVKGGRIQEINSDTHDLWYARDMAHKALANSSQDHDVVEVWGIYNTKGLQNVTVPDDQANAECVYYDGRKQKGHAIFPKPVSDEKCHVGGIIKD